MRDNDWRILYELYLTPNITKVAEKMYMTQPTLTKRLQYIEEEFQTRIVSRSTKGVTFTKEGEYLARQAELYLQFRGGIDRRMEAFKQEGLGTIRVASSLTFSKEVLPVLIEKFQKKYPNVSFDIQTSRSTYLAQFLTDGTSDLAFVRGEYECDLYKKRLTTEQAYLISKESLNCDELLKYCRIETIYGESSRKQLNQWWNERFEEGPSCSVTVGFHEVAWEMVRKGVGYSLAFAQENDMKTDGIYYTPLIYKNGTPVKRNTWLIYSKDTEKSPYVEEFIELVEHSF